MFNPNILTISDEDHFKRNHKQNLHIAPCRICLPTRLGVLQFPFLFLPTHKHRLTCIFQHTPRQHYPNKQRPPATGRRPLGATTASQTAKSFLLPASRPKLKKYLREFSEAQNIGHSGESIIIIIKGFGSKYRTWKPEERRETMKYDAAAGTPFYWKYNVI